MSTKTPTTWTYKRACECVDVRDMDRSAISSVPKQSGPSGRYSHHHRKLRSRGGTDSPANLSLLLGSGTTGEHGWVHQHVGEATVLGYIVHSWQEPSEVPIYRVDMFGISYGWHLQTDDGDVIPCAPPADHPADVLAAALLAFHELKTKSRLDAIHHL